MAGRDALREKHGCVDWRQLIWFSLTIPKNALTTGDKLLKWGYHGDTFKCMFRLHVIEDRDYLFFGCNYGAW
jgi:hypothetical protein